MELQARVRVWGRPRGRSGARVPRVSMPHFFREDARVGAGTQDGEPVVRSRVRIKLPDGDVKVVYTDSEGVTRIDGLAIPGMAEIELLDFPEAGEATAIEDEPVTPVELDEKEFLVKVVDEIGKPLAGVPM